MNEYLTSFLSLFLIQENQLILMFLSAFLSATVLPGNSEVIFSTIATQALISDPNLFSDTLFWLLLTATFGNSLGSLTTYFMAQIFPQPKLSEKQHKSVQFTLKFSEKYGIWVLLLSWLPVIGDLFCAIAGWLRFNLWKSMLLITLGKGIRYALLLWSIYLVVA